MNTAVEKGAKEDKSFEHYVDYLFENGDITAGMKDWVDYIRKRGNAATHEISVFDWSEAENLLLSTEHLLRVIFELPAKHAGLTGVPPAESDV